MQGLEKQLKALANRRRLAILKTLSKSPNSSVKDIAKNIKLSFRSTSKHLSLLRSADIIEREQKSTLMFYNISKPYSSLIKTILSIV